MINRNALFSDETEFYKSPYLPQKGDRVTLTFRTLADNCNYVYAVVNEKRHAMRKFKREQNFDYYSYSFVCPQSKVNYYFLAYDEDDRVCYNRLGGVENHQSEFSFGFIPNYYVPEWARGTVFYQIFPDRFCNGDLTNDVADNEYYYTGGHSKRITDWEKFPDELDVRCFYGGDLQGVMQKLDYLKDLGVEAIYFNPIFLSPSNHKYDTQDYDYVDPHLAIIEDDVDHEMEDWEKHNGFAQKYIKRVTSKNNLKKSNQYFCSLVKEIHKRGMKVVVDGVFNHCGSFNKWLDREGVYLNKKGYELGAYQSTESPYRNYFNFNNKDEAYSGYEGWWGFDTLPKLNYEKSEELAEYIIATGGKWVSPPFNVDGWRLDVAADLGHSSRYNHSFWQKFHARVREANPEAFIFAEHYGDPESWLNGKEWDSIMNYDAFMEPITWFFTGMEKHSEGFDGGKRWDGEVFFESMMKNMSRLPRPAIDSALNQLSNHDHSRFLTRTNGVVGTTKTKGAYAAGENVDKRVFCLAVLVQMTWPGSPGIYYADEAGQVGWTDPDSRRTYPWGKEDKELIDYHKRVIALRKKIECLKLGSIKKIDAGNGYIAYGRMNEKECCLVVVNCSNKDTKLSLPVWELGVPHNGVTMMRMFGYKESRMDEFEEEKEIKYGRLSITLPEKSGAVYYYKF